MKAPLRIPMGRDKKYFVEERGRGHLLLEIRIEPIPDGDVASIVNI